MQGNRSCTRRACRKSLTIEGHRHEIRIRDERIGIPECLLQAQHRFPGVDGPVAVGIREHDPAIAPARAGAIAPVDVTIPAQVTSLGPEKTSFFQALQIPTKITRGTIEIIVRRYSNVRHESNVNEFVLFCLFCRMMSI